MLTCLIDEDACSYCIYIIKLASNNALLLRQEIKFKGFCFYSFPQTTDLQGWDKMSSSMSLFIGSMILNVDTATGQQITKLRNVRNREIN